MDTLTILFKLTCKNFTLPSSMVVVKQVNDVSVKSNSLLFTADLRNYTSFYNLYTMHATTTKRFHSSSA